MHAYGDYRRWNLLYLKYASNFYPGRCRDSDEVRLLLANVDETDGAEFLNGDRKLEKTILEWIRLFVRSSGRFWLLVVSRENLFNYGSSCWFVKDVQLQDFTKQSLE